MDNEVKKLFENDLKEYAETDKNSAWDFDHEGILAAIILCSSMPRMMYRGKAKAYDYDEKAITLAKQVVKEGQFDNYKKQEKCSIIIAIANSESIEDTDTAMRLADKTGDEIMSHANDQNHLIDAFGRFPDRNRVLGRTSTGEEKSYLYAVAQN